MSQNSAPLSIKDIFYSSDRYLIPLYQRPYAWRSEEIEQLIDDIYAAKKENKENYYLGTLVVFYRKGVGYETVDGQQRLTTLLLLLGVLEEEKKINKEKIIFKNRPKSQKTLEKFLEGANLEQLGGDLDNGIRNGIEAIQKKLELGELKDLEEKKSFKNYLLDKVKLFRVELPKGTDLNHYFEIMNNRGEQLQMHEVVKARLLEPFKDDNDCVNMLGQIWDSCMNMERYIQKNFPYDVFGDDLNKLNFSKLECKENKNQKNTRETNSEKKEKKLLDFLEEIKNGKANFSNESKKDDDKESHFIPLIDFPNFLLHVLRIYAEKENWGKQEDDLNDKKLLELFENSILKEENRNKENIKEFFETLLTLRFLLDNFVIHRSKNDDEEKMWVLKKFVKEEKNNNENENKKNDKKNQKLIKLLSMFEVSYPGKVRKEWLSGVLRFLYKSWRDKGDAQSIIVEKYIEYLETSAEKLLKGYYLRKEEEKNKEGKENSSFYDIFKDELFQISNDNLNWEKLNQGTATPNFAFNYLDYLLWRDCGDIFKFNFKYHNSVEHFYPRTPISGKNPPENVDSFGNLYLTSRSINSKLSNHPPKTKVEQYKNTHHNKLPEFPKQKIMYSKAVNGEWNKEKINEHTEMMKKILENVEVDKEKMKAYLKL